MPIAALPHGWLWNQLEQAEQDWFAALDTAIESLLPVSTTFSVGFPGLAGCTYNFSTVGLVQAFNVPGGLLPVGAIPYRMSAKMDPAFAGPGLSDLGFALGIAAVPAAALGAALIGVGSSAKSSINVQPLGMIDSEWAGTQPIVTFTSIGCNVSAYTAGKVEIEIIYRTSK